MSAEHLESFKLPLFEQSSVRQSHCKLQEVVKIIASHLKCSTEFSEFTISRHLQALSVVTDSKIFDPRSDVVTKFFASLYQLADTMDSNSPFVWYFVEVLSNGCNNPEMRQALIHTYQFVPHLARLLGDHLTKDKKVKVLKLLLDLTCGFKMHYQIPHLAHLVQILVLWIEGDDHELLGLSVGVLANLCYQNIPALYTLMGTADLKHLLRICSTLQDGEVGMHAFKLLMGIEYQEWTSTSFDGLVLSTVTSILEGFICRNRVFLNQAVDFFYQIADKHDLRSALVEKKCERMFSKLLQAVACGTTKGNEASCDSQLFECVALVLQYFTCVVSVRSPLTAPPTQNLMVDVALKWLEFDETSSQSLDLLNKIAAVVDATSTDVISSLSNGLPAFFNLLRLMSSQVGQFDFVEVKKTTALLRLLGTLSHIGPLTSQILNQMEVSVLRDIFAPIVEITDPSTALVGLYVSAAALMQDLCGHEPKWLPLQTEVFKHPQMHLILSHGLNSDSKEVIAAVLNLRAAFPIDDVASILQSMHKDATVAPVPTRKELEIKEPLLAIAQLHRIDEVLDRLQSVANSPRAGDAAVCDVMQLYEFKLVSVSHSERMALAGIEAASERCTQLQHRNAELSAAINKHHQLLYHAQSCAEQRLKSAANLETIANELDRKCKAAEASSNELQKNLDIALEAARKQEERLASMNKSLNKFKESAHKWEYLAQERDDFLRKANEDNADLKAIIKEKDVTIKDLKDKMDSLVKDLEVKNTIINTITKLATSQSTS